VERWSSGTADRDDVQFSIPHCHVSFGQSFQEYNLTLEQWLQNFQTTGIQTVNFGYILIQSLLPQQTGSYYLRLGIIELRTKTTPTCWSSYLNR